MKTEVNKKKSGISDKKKQQILVPHDFSGSCNCAVAYAIDLAKIFKCEISIMHILTPKLVQQYGNIDVAENFARNKLAIISANIQTKENVIVNAYCFKGKVRDIIHTFSVKINAIIIVAGLNSVNRNLLDYFSPSSLVSDYRSLRIPILIVHNKMPEYQTFRQIIVPVDHTKESKEKASWAGYFSKLHKSHLTVVHTEYSDEFFNTQLKNNLILVSRLFNTLGAIFEIHKVKKIRYRIDKYALSYAKIKNAGMVIIMATKEFGFEEFILGPVEKKIITNEAQLPVMMINPRDDIYVPCI